jgi:hypothetical protein
MSRQKFEKTFNTFTKGLMTEASEINFPENFSLYEKNFLLHKDGGRDRRRGMQLLYPLGATLTSNLYPLEFSDGIAPGLVGPSTDRKTILKNFYVDDSVGVGLLPPAIYRRAAVRYFEYKNGEPESVEVGLVAPSISRRNTVKTYRAEPEQLSIGLLPPAVFRKKVADYLEYENPEESISVGLLAPTIKRTNT